MSKNFVKPFRMGDVVRVVDRPASDGEHIVYKVCLEGGDFEYSTHCEAWFDHDELELVRECDEASINALIESIDEDDEDD